MFPVPSVSMMAGPVAVAPVVAEASLHPDTAFLVSFNARPCPSFRISATHPSRTAVARPRISSSVVV